MSEEERAPEIALTRRTSHQSNERGSQTSEQSHGEHANRNQRRLIDGAAGFIREMFHANSHHAGGAGVVDARSEGSAASDRETLMEELRRDLAENGAVLESMEVKRKLRLRQQKVLTLEIRSSGETQYKQRTLRDLFLYIRKLISEIEELSTDREELYEHVRSTRRNTRTSGQWLRARDLHKIESFATSEPMIMVRRHCILLAIEPLRGVILWDRLIVLVPDGADSLLHVLETELQSHVQDAEQYGADTTPVSLRPSSAAAQLQQHQQRRRSFPGKGSASARLSSSDLRQTLPDDTTLHWSQDAEMSLQARHRPSQPTSGLRRSVSESRLQMERDGDGSEGDGTASEGGATAVLGPFELRALEAVLATIVYLQNRAYEKLNARTEAVISQISKLVVVSAETQERLRLLKNATTGLSARMQSYLRALEEVLENDEDMALMNLSKLHDKPSLYTLPLQPEIMNAHEEMELLFEAYVQDFNTLSTNLKILQGNVTNAEELLSLRLDTARNQLLTAETIFTLISMCFAIGSYIGSIFGMNLLNHLEDEQHTFKVVTVLTTGGVVILGLAIFFYFRQRGLFVA